MARNSASAADSRRYSPSVLAMLRSALASARSSASSPVPFLWRWHRVSRWSTPRPVLHKTAVGRVSNYNLRSMIVRKGTATMTALGIAMVVAVFVMTLSIAQGFQSTLVASGSPQNAIVMRKGATSENVSAIAKQELPLIQTFPQIARDANGHPLASPELVVIISLPRKTNNEPANVPVRGVGSLAFDVREN